MLDLTVRSQRGAEASAPAEALERHASAPGTFTAARLWPRGARPCGHNRVRLPGDGPLLCDPPHRPSRDVAARQDQRRADDCRGFRARRSNAPAAGSGAEDPPQRRREVARGRNAARGAGSSFSPAVRRSAPSRSPRTTAPGSRASTATFRAVFAAPQTIAKLSAPAQAERTGDRVRLRRAAADSLVAARVGQFSRRFR